MEDHLRARTLPLASIFGKTRRFISRFALSHPPAASKIFSAERFSIDSLFIVIYQMDNCSHAQTTSVVAKSGQETDNSLPDLEAQTDFDESEGVLHGAPE